MVHPEEPPSRNKKHAAPFIGRRVAVHANALGLASAVSAQRVEGTVMAYQQDRHMQKSLFTVAFLSETRAPTVCLTWSQLLGEQALPLSPAVHTPLLLPSDGAAAAPVAAARVDLRNVVQGGAGRKDSRNTSAAGRLGEQELPLSHAAHTPVVLPSHGAAAAPVAAGRVDVRNVVQGGARCRASRFSIPHAAPNRSSTPCGACIVASRGVRRTRQSRPRGRPLMHSKRSSSV
jgi:hypothetical protein